MQRLRFQGANVLRLVLGARGDKTSDCVGCDLRSCLSRVTWTCQRWRGGVGVTSSETGLLREIQGPAGWVACSEQAPAGAGTTRQGPGKQVQTELGAGWSCGRGQGGHQGTVPRGEGPRGAAALFWRQQVPSAVHPHQRHPPRGRAPSPACQRGPRWRPACAPVGTSRASSQL